MKRRSVVGPWSIAVIGTPLLRFGEQLVERALPPADEPLPSRLDISHVHTVRTATGRLRELARQHGGHAKLFSSAATAESSPLPVSSEPNCTYGPGNLVG